MVLIHAEIHAILLEGVRVHRPAVLPSPRLAVCPMSICRYSLSRGVGTDDQYRAVASSGRLVATDGVSQEEIANVHILGSI